jgi:hypothetical protein
VIESDNLREGLWPIRKRVDKVQYFLEHHDGFFYILTNAPVNDTETTTEGYYLARCRAEKSLVDRWQVSLFLCGLLLVDLVPLWKLNRCLYSWGTKEICRQCLLV